MVRRKSYRAIGCGYPRAETTRCPVHFKGEGARMPEKTSRGESVNNSPAERREMLCFSMVSAAPDAEICSRWQLETLCILTVSVRTGSHQVDARAARRVYPTRGNLSNRRARRIACHPRSAVRGDIPAKSIARRSTQRFEAFATAQFSDPIGRVDELVPLGFDDGRYERPFVGQAIGRTRKNHRREGMPG